jgi:hypothetical protein
MSEALRGFVLLLSVLLWLPVLRPLLDGEMSTDEAALRYGAALLFSWGGVTALAALMRAYTPKPVELEEPATPALTAGAAAGTAASEAPAPDGSTDELMPDGTLRRRAEDLTS